MRRSSTQASPRRLVLVNQYYWPDVAATAQLLADLGAHMAAQGMEVQALASRAIYASAEGEAQARSRRDVHAGVEIVRLRAPDLGRRRTLGRIADYACYLAQVSWRALRARPGDCWLCLSTPPLVAAVGLLARWRGARFVYKVEDLYPDVGLSLGVIRGRAIPRALRWLSRRLLRSAHAVVVLDEGMRDAVHVRAGPHVPVHVIPNWADGEAITPREAGASRLRRRLGLSAETLVVGYSGNFGRAHRFDELLEVATRAEVEGRPVHYLFIGDGAARPAIAALAARQAQVSWLPYQPRAALADTLAAADVHVVSLRSEVEGLLFPSKLAGVLAAGRPVLALADADGALGRIVQDAACGWVTDHDLEGLRSALAEAADPVRRAAMGANARACFDAHYARGAGLAAWKRVVIGERDGAS